MPRTACVVVFATVCLVACSRSEPPQQAAAPPPAPVVVPAPSPPPEPVVTQAAAREPVVEQHIPGSPEAKLFIAANVVKQPVKFVKHAKPAAKTPARRPDTAYDKAYRNAARADKLLQRHAYVVSFDDAGATNAVPLGSEYR